MARQVQASKMVKRRRSYKPKAYGRRALTSRKTKSVLRLSRGDYGFPDRIVTKLRYSDWITLSGTPNTVRSNLFRMNSIYDPDYTGTGHQPQWHDQLSGIYQKYRVLGSKLTATFTPFDINGDETSVNGPWIVGATGLNSVTFTQASIGQLVEDADAATAVIGDRQGGPNQKTLSVTFSPNRDLGMGADDDTTSASFGTNPAQGFYGSVWMVENSGSGVTANMKVLVVMEFTVECFQRYQGLGS